MKYGIRVTGGLLVFIASRLSLIGVAVSCQTLHAVHKKLRVSKQSIYANSTMHREKENAQT